MYRFVFFAVSAILASCASSTTTHLPSGEIGHSIDCSGTGLSWGRCYEKAGEICGVKGYTVVAGGSEQGAIATANQEAFFGGSVMKRTLLIQCGQHDAA